MHVDPNNLISERSRSPGMPQSPRLAALGGSSSRSTLQVERDVSKMSITQRAALGAMHAGEAPGIADLISQELDMTKYRYLLDIPKKNLDQTQKQLLELVEQRRSKIGYVHA